MIVSARKLLDIALVACIACPTAQSAFGQAGRPAAPPAGEVAPNGQVGQNRTGVRTLVTPAVIRIAFCRGARSSAPT